MIGAIRRFLSRFEHPALAEFDRRAAHVMKLFRESEIETGQVVTAKLATSKQVETVRLATVKLETLQLQIGSVTSRPR
ncbi:hypothetical protein [Inquilinus sp. OTU3971]|uniref:hypothetical protein n=1 Tax=Inquilinus sp. OTU3971 TaxID=3043855 RepID=UPI00313B85FB